MEKPYQKDLDFLNEELAHHEYIARKFSQEHNDVYAKEFKEMCAEIWSAIEVVENRQAAAVSEWSALSPSKRRSILLPLFGALEKVIEDAKTNGCPEFATYLDEYLTNFLIDLQNFTE